ncbi:MAG: dTDP-4-dehydrorhamnose reductase [Herminiimonas sp.]|nr:dTDP-4-dehydrorhamnose reductase [Herminiimonas sp.]MDB5855922.1 dTDP-4-dehydrorhamnose reductase [Herminiimonas sp.]
MKILLTGRTGQVGYELQRSLQGLGEVVAPDRAQLDLANLDGLRAAIQRIRPDLIVNPAAYTAVDKAEAEPELAMRLNRDAPAIMAEEARKLGATMIHYSTDYVFDGTKQGAYLEDDPTNPLSVYGKTKLAGEQAIAATGIPHLILRTSWVYGMRGKNFLLTMLRLAAERESLQVVNDQFGAPTWARTVAEATAHIVAQAVGAHQSGAGPQTTWWHERSGIYHLTAQGRTSWHDFTAAILAQATLERRPTLIPIPSSDYPTPAARPENSSLCCDRFMQQFCGLPDWEEALALCLAQ